MPSDTPPPNFVLRSRFDDIDDLATEAKMWNLDFRQLAPGKFRGETLQIGVNGVHISDAQFCQSLQQKGVPPVGMRTITVPAKRDLRVEWRGKKIDGDSLMIFPQGSELSAVSGPDFHVYTCSFHEDLLAIASESLQMASVDEIAKGVEALRIGDAAMRPLRSCLSRICQSIRADPDSLSDARLVQQLTFELPSRLIAAIHQGQGSCPEASPPKRQSAIARAEAFIEQHAAEGIGVRELCRVAGVSERTLQYAFLERFGIGPKEFLNAFRLVAVRRQLRAADPRTTKVADVANAWGFWHMGQFAADYRRRFEELPSDTLRFHSK